MTFALETRTHDAHCFVCVQYLHYLKLFCRLNTIDIYRARIPVDAILINHTDCKRVLLVNQALPPSAWLPAAFDLLGLPARVTPPPETPNEAHYGVFISLNTILAAFALVGFYAM